MAIRQLKHTFFIIPAILVAGMLVSCGQADLEKVHMLTSGEDLPVQTDRDADYFYSDSARLKFRLMAPQLDRYLGEEPYVEFPEGVEIRFYDKKGDPESQLKANYGIRYEKKGVMEARDDVVVINAKGEKINTEQLIWNEETGEIISETFVKITQKDQIIYGNGLKTNRNFSPLEIIDLHGVIDIEEEPEDDSEPEDEP